MHFRVVYIQNFKIICSQCRNFSLYFIGFSALVRPSPPSSLLLSSSSSSPPPSSCRRHGRKVRHISSQLQNRSDTQAVYCLGCELSDQETRFKLWQRRAVFLQNLQTVTHPSTQDVTPALSPGVKLHTTVLLVPRFKMSGTLPPPRTAFIAYSNNFTLILNFMLTN